MILVFIIIIVHSIVYWQELAVRPSNMSVRK